jgi:xanthine/CO dehydrogenase XdhC/CoxF family maturation factor
MPPSTAPASTVLLVAGATRLARVLVPMAALAGFETHWVDPRVSGEDAASGVRCEADFLRFTEAVEVTREVAVLAITREPALVAAALQEARRRKAFYVGVLSVRCGEAAGMATADLLPAAPAHGECAVAILARIIAARHRQKAI